MAIQLTFELATAPAPTFSSFVSGPNREAVESLHRHAGPGTAETALVLWGANGAGKTHLLQASVAAARELARTSHYVSHPREIRDNVCESAALIAIDRVDHADPDSQARLFTLYNALTASGGRLVVAAGVPPARMSLRDDLRTRLGWGLVYEISPLSDADKPAALATFALARGFRLSADAIDYLLAHGQRDMAWLVAALTALDRHSLSLQRPITVPLIREWLQREAAPLHRTG